MSDPEPIGAPGKGQLDKEAATWCMRMHSEDADRWRADFEAWLRRGALHRRAYNRMEEVYLLGAKLRSTAETSTPALVARPGGKVLLPLAGAGLVAACFAIALSLGGEVRGDSAAANEIAIVPNGSARLAATETGSARFRLEDGSQLLLLKNSVVRVAYSPLVRMLDLEQGTGRFAVAHDGRPFTVRAGGGTITARGTLFEVTDQAGTRVDVHLLRGKVDVGLPSASTASPVSPRIAHLVPGQRISFAALAPRAGGVEAVPAAERDSAQPATVGALIDLANMKPGASARIILQDPTIRATRLSGSFKVHDPAVVADRLATMLGLVLDRSRPGILLMRRPATP